MKEHRRDLHITKPGVGGVDVLKRHQVKISMKRRAKKKRIRNKEKRRNRKPNF